MEHLRLCTFGGLTLQVGSETTTGASTRPHRLALLVLLAVARQRGLSRDKLHAYLWPESDTTHARHGLNQLLYFQRHQLYEGGLLLGRKTLRLNRELISTDIWDFEDALEAGAQQTAVELYAGPFLDGFFLTGAPSFERWVAEQRQRFEEQYLGAIAALAEAAATAGLYAQAVSWWRRAAALDPLDAETARRLAEACVAAGDRPAALRHLHDHEDLVRAELGMAPDPGVIRLVEQLRGG